MSLVGQESANANRGPFNSKPR